MAANTEDLSDSTVSGFHTIDTRRFEGFTPQNLDEFNRILLSIKKNDKFHFLETFRQQIESHIANPAGHLLSFSLLEDEIVDHLYVMYTDRGYTGSKLDMLENFHKNIEVGNNDDIKAGISFEKAMSTVFWKQWFDEHNDGLGSHMTIRRAFYPVNTVNKVAALSVNDYNPVKELTIDKNWNSSEMTVTFDYDCSKKVTGSLFDIYFDDDKLMEIVGSDTGVKLIYDDISLALDFPVGIGVNQYLIYFTSDKLVFRDVLNRKVITNAESNSGNTVRYPFTGSATSIVFTSTAGDFGSYIPRFSVFPGSIRDSEELFFVN